jgi:hypothetical protein
MMKVALSVAATFFAVGSIQSQSPPPPSPKATVVIAGVADAATGQPLEGAQVQMPEVGKFGRTNWIGEAILEAIPVGKHRIQVRKLGYTPADIDLLIQGDSLGPVFMLERSVQSLDTVFIGGAWRPKRMSEFYSREAMHIGRFLSDSALQTEKTRDLGLILSMRFPGLRVQPDEQSPGHYRLVSTRPQTANALRSVAGPCPVDVFIDGFRSFDDLRGLYPTDLAGIEFYPVESAPVQFRLNTGSCAVLVLWTKY